MFSGLGPTDLVNDSLLSLLVLVPVLLLLLLLRVGAGVSMLTSVSVSVSLPTSMLGVNVNVGVNRGTWSVATMPVVAGLPEMNLQGCGLGGENSAADPRDGGEHDINYKQRRDPIWNRVFTRDGRRNFGIARESTMYIHTG